MWQGQDLEEKYQRLLAIGIPSTTVLVGCQIYVAISICVVLVHKIQSCDVPLIENWRAMRRRDMLLLFPGLLVLEIEVIQHLPWDQSISTNATVADGFPHRYFARAAFMAVFFGEFPRILLQNIFIGVIKGSDRWEMMGAIASVTLSVSDLTMENSFIPLVMKARA